SQGSVRRQASRRRELLCLNGWQWSSRSPSETWPGGRPMAETQLSRMRNNRSLRLIVAPLLLSEKQIVVRGFVQNNCMIDHRLHVLRVLAACGTVNGAAATLNYTPSAVSHQIRGLAQELGVTLLVKEGRGVRLTPAARLLLARADELFAR